MAVMTPLQYRMLELVLEIDAICKKHGIVYLYLERDKDNWKLVRKDTDNGYSIETYSDILSILLNGENFYIRNLMV